MLNLGNRLIGGLHGHINNLHLGNISNQSESGSHQMKSKGTVNIFVLLFCSVAVLTGCTNSRVAVDAMRSNDLNLISTAVSSKTSAEVIACLQEEVSIGYNYRGGVPLSKMDLPDRTRLFTINNALLFDVFSEKKGSSIKATTFDGLVVNRLMRHGLEQCTDSQTISNTHK